MPPPVTIPALANTWVPQWIAGTKIPADAFAEAGSASQPAGLGSAKILAKYLVAPMLSVGAFGAKGDFDPSTGAGTDDRAAIQSALTFAASLASGARLVFPPGRYYLGAGFASGVYQLLLSSAANVTIEGYGAILYPGAAGSALGMDGCINCHVRGLKAVGYCGGALGAGREHDNLIALLNSSWIFIADCYLTNCLGDCVYVGGNGLCQHVRISGCVLKERYGNGTRSSAGGSRSRLSLAVINAYDVQVTGGCNIIGGVDFENNLAAEYLKALTITGNNFTSGHVTPQAAIGTAYWFDEPIAATGGTVIDQGIQMSGPGMTTAGQYSAAVVADNFFESAAIFFNSEVYRLFLKNNHFAAGLITLGDTSGSNTNSNYVVEGNTCDALLAGQTCFIKLGGATYNGRFTDNHAIADNGYVFGVDPGNGVDTRSNYFANNVNTSTNSPLGVFSWTQQKLSVYVGNWCYVGGGAAERADTFAMKIAKRSGGAWPSVDVGATASAALDYKTLASDNFILASSLGGTLGSIANCPDGAEITIEADAPAITVVNSGSIRLKGGVNAVMTDGNSILTLVARAGLLWEKCRNF